MDDRIAAERARQGYGKYFFLLRDERQIDFGVRRFNLSSGPQREILETASRAFLTGFNAAISSPADLAAQLDDLSEQQHGHALEGAGMAAAVLDMLTLRPGKRLRALLAGTGRGYPQLIMAGAGRGYASMRRRPSRLISKLPADRVTNPALRWFAWDGYGYHLGFFTSDQTIGGQRQPRRLGTEELSLFDQGVGRSLWYHECADPEGVALRIAEFAPARRADLWCGAGLAAAYTGGAAMADLSRLATLARQNRPDLACGAALACAARAHAGLIPACTGAAAHELIGAPAQEASGWVATALSELGHRAAGPGGYRLWRSQIGDLWTAYHSRSHLDMVQPSPARLNSRPAWSPDDPDRTGTHEEQTGVRAERVSLDTEPADPARWDFTQEFAPYVPAQARTATPAPVPPSTPRTAESEQ